MWSSNDMYSVKYRVGSIRLCLNAQKEERILISSILSCDSWPPTVISDHLRVISDVSVLLWSYHIKKHRGSNRINHRRPCNGVLPREFVFHKNHGSIEKEKHSVKSEPMMNSLCLPLFIPIVCRHEKQTYFVMEPIIEKKVWLDESRPANTCRFSGTKQFYYNISLPWENRNLLTLYGSNVLITI